MACLTRNDVLPDAYNPFDWRVFLLVNGHGDAVAGFVRLIAGQDQRDQRVPTTTLCRSDKDVHNKQVGPRTSNRGEPSKLYCDARLGLTSEHVHLCFLRLSPFKSCS